MVIYPQVEAPSSVKSLNDSSISASISGAVKDIPAEVGNLVQKGTILVHIDDSDFVLEKERLEIRLKRVAKQRDGAFRDYQRKKRSKGAVSKTVVSRAATEYAVLNLDHQDTQAQLKLAENKIQRCTIRAPFTGIIRERLGRVGEFISPGKPLIRIIDVENIEVAANVQTKDVQSLEKAKEINFVFNKQVFPLKLRSVVKVRDQRTRTQEVRLSFVDKEELPGTAGRLRWIHTQPHIPPELMVRRQGKLGIFILKNKKAHFLPMEGALEGRPIPTILPLSTKIIVKGRNGIKHGARLKK